MFGFSLHVQESATRMVVTDPFSVIAVGISFIYTCSVFAILLGKHFPRNKTIVYTIIFLLIWSFALSAEKVTLDKTTQTAMIEEFEFFHWMRRTVPLNSIDNVTVRTGSTTSAVQLQFTNGHVHSMSAMNQEGGKEEAAYAMNRFLSTATNRVTQ